MYKRVKLEKLDDYFLPMSQRTQKGVYFGRLNKYTDEVDGFMQHYMREARSCGIIIMDKLQNPDEKQLAYYNEIMGMDFPLASGGDVTQSMNNAMAKWLPRLQGRQRDAVVNSMLQAFARMRAQGKNDNMLKNAYIKFMCWLYYRLERIMKDLGSDRVPKILYEGQISNYELTMLSIIAEAGCDILLVQYKGDADYLKLDPGSEESFEIPVGSGRDFPEGYSVRELQKKEQQRAELSMLYDEKSTKIAATNTWIIGEPLKDSIKSLAERGENNVINNVFIRMTGVEDKPSYSSELMHWKMEVESRGRKVTILEELEPPAPNEIASVNKNNYEKLSQLLRDLTGKLKSSIAPEIQNQIRRAFVELMQEQAEIEANNMNRLKNQAIYLICWFNRHERQLFEGYRPDKEYNVFVYYGVCKSNFEALYMRLLSKMPLDILLINPDLTRPCQLQDKMLFDKKYSFTLKQEHFPTEAGQISFGTAAYHAEQELTEIMYQDSGMYRVQQYQKAKTIALQTMYEEMYLLWDQEVRFRPNFEIIDDQVMLPVMFEKVSGVKDGITGDYWKEMKKLIVEDTLLVKGISMLDQYVNIDSQLPVSFLKNGKLQRREIMNHPNYPYKIFREETQEYILDKLQELLDSGWIQGTYSTGVEYKIISVVMHLGKEITRLIQKADFTKKLPKLVLVNTDEQVISLEGAILLAFLHLTGFDIAVFVPTGYQVIERYYTKQIFLEHNIGEYMYDLNIPMGLASDTTRQREGFINKLFKRGRS